MLTLIALSVGLLLPAGGGLTRRDALAAVAATPALLARPVAAPAATSAVPTKDMESIKALTLYLLCPLLTLARAARWPTSGLLVARWPTSGWPTLTMTIRKVLASKAKALRAAVRSTAAGRRSLAMDPTPGYNNYQATTEAVRHAHA